MDAVSPEPSRGGPRPGFHLAQLNVGKLIAPVGDPAVAEFIDALDEINALGEASDGFVWRLKGDNGNATSFRAFPDPDIIPNLTVWTSVDALKAYAYRSHHVDFFKRRAEWFMPGQSGVVLWWVPAGHIPTLAEARRRLEFLQANGPSPYAFGFASVTVPLTFRRADVDDPDALGLIGELNAHLDSLYPGPGENHFTLTNDDVAPGMGALLVGMLDGEAVACGAIRTMAGSTVSAFAATSGSISDSTATSASASDGAPPTTAGMIAEVKRMYSRPDRRGLKLGAAILTELEAHARELGATRMVLETGPLQPSALALYDRFGYHRCDCWGEYLDSPENSLCMSKELPAG